jgi:glycosyltransferase involved in cell wall biosynthesis
MKKIWITWEEHRRTEELASALPGIKLFEFDLEAHRLVRYPLLLLWTISILIRQRPDIVIIQNPSIVLAFFMVTIGKLIKFRVVVDAHNEGIQPFYSKYNWLLPIYATIQKWADLTIVTNEELARIVRNNGGRPFVLPDKIPQFDSPEHIKLKGKHNFVFICTFAKDEPYEDVIQAAKLIDSSTCIYITGRYQKASSDIIKQSSPNVIFAGFLPEQTYINLLYSCDVVIDLTLMQDCLVCGAYEAIALGKPVILSNTQALRNYFYQGAVYTENSVDEIAKNIKYAIRKKGKLENEVIVLRDQLQLEWKKRRSNLLHILEQFSEQKT